MPANAHQDPVQECSAIPHANSCVKGNRIDSIKDKIEQSNHFDEAAAIMMIHGTGIASTYQLPCFNDHPVNLCTDAASKRWVETESAGLS